MKCEIIHKDLIFFLEKELPAVELAKIERHLSECADCSLFAQEMAKTLQIIHTEKLLQPTPFFYGRLKARLENGAHGNQGWAWAAILKPALQPAFFSLLLMAGVYSGFKIGKPNFYQAADTVAKQEIIPYLDEMETEPIENFLMDGL